MQSYEVQGTARDIRGLKALLAADWARSSNRTAAQRLTLLIFRVGQYVRALRRRGLLFYAWRVADFVYLRLLLGAELAPTAQVGPGLALPHAGRGVMWSDDAEIGENSMIFPRAVIGSDLGDGPARLGHDVQVGTGRASSVG